MISITSLSIQCSQSYLNESLNVNSMTHKMPECLNAWIPENNVQLDPQIQVPTFFGSVSQNQSDYICLPTLAHRRRRPHLRLQVLLQPLPVHLRPVRHWLTTFIDLCHLCQKCDVDVSHFWQRSAPLPSLNLCHLCQKCDITASHFWCGIWLKIQVCREQSVTSMCHISRLKHVLKPLE